MRNDNRSANNIRNSKKLVHLLRSDFKLMTLTEVILNAVVATQHHTCCQSKHFFGFFIKRTVFIGIRIQVPKSLHYQVILTEDDIIHLLPVIIEFGYEVRHCYRFHKNRKTNWMMVSVT